MMIFHIYVKLPEGMGMGQNLWNIIRNYHVLLREPPSINQLYPTILVYLGSEGFDP